MIDEDKIINRIWAKYENYPNSRNKDKFFKKNHFKYDNFKYTTLLTCLVILIGSFGIGYAGKIIYDSSKNKIAQEISESNHKYQEYNYLSDMTFDENTNLFYKTITKYEDYLNYYNIFDNFVEMKEEDFNEYFVLAITSETNKLPALEITNIYSEEQALNVELTSCSEDRKRFFISSKVPLNDFRNIVNFNLKVNYDVPIVSNQPSLSSLPSDYQKTDAINDGCFVLCDDEIISNNYKQLDEFIENTQNNVASAIRIVDYNYGNIIVTDIEFKDNEYIVCVDNTRNNSGTFDYYKGTTLGIGYNEALKDKRKVLLKKEENSITSIIICIIKDKN